ncbi:PilZ domain-containing protein [Sphingobium sp. AP49]|uniref:PilZ domain-containing protein n=1 Tax=Sphingobium sp. AP49 TaxID=1144307 RepID=UPI00026EDB0B|nr:PilZ domain-containing protein [Sphingobium sp. AP49]WHO37507.1 PilZ domain-containing protein [Sphingobium sp. AP49]
MSSVFANLGHVMRSRDPSIDQRRVSRDLVDMVSHITVHGRTHGVRIINISALGLMCRAEEALTAVGPAHVWLPLLKDRPADIRWIEDGRIGLEFIDPIPAASYDAMMALIPPRRTAW